MSLAIVQRAFEDSPYCGDQARCWPGGPAHRMTLCMADGLGHGLFAEKAATAAVDYIAGHLAEPLPALFAGCDRAIRRTRGAALGIAVVDEEAGTLTYAGVGNTRAMIVRGGRDVFCLSSSYGIVGGGYRKLTLETVPFLPGDLVILYTDGIKERCDVLAYDDALRSDVQRLAERILRDWSRETDDAAVLVFRSEEL